MTWSVYLARCRDQSLYCGIAADVPARIAEHDAGKGARYTRGRGPLTVLAVRRCRDKGVALSIEHAIKRLSRAEKLALAAAPDRLGAIARAVYRKRAARVRAIHRVAILALMSFGALCRARSAHAESDAIRLTYEAPAGCPDEAGLVSRIQARRPLRIAPAGESVPLFSVALRPRGDVLVGRVASTSDTGETATREVTGTNCSELVDALALIVSMSFAPSPPTSAASADAEPGTNLGAAGPGGAAAGELPVTAEPPAAEHPENAARRGAPYRLAAAAEGEVILGYVPAPLYGIGARVELVRAHGPSPGAPAIALGVSVIQPTDRALGVGHAELSWVNGQLFLCPVSFALSSSLSLLPCGRLDVGQVRAEGSQIAHQQTRKLLWSSIGPVADLSWTPFEPLLVSAQASLLVPLTTYRFVFDPDTTIYESPHVGFSAALSAGVLFW